MVNTKVLLGLLLAVSLMAGPTSARKRPRPKIVEMDEDLDTLTNLINDDDSSDKAEKDEDPCMKKHCGAGQECVLDPLGAPACQCVSECPEEMEPRRKVCSNHNTTYGSDCELYRLRCWCKKGDAKCEGNADLIEKHKHMHIEYYGECRQMEECTTGQMADFPRRMRDWLFNIMQDMAEREELSAHYLKMEKEAQNNLTRRWANAAIWKWCDLDASQDRAVSRHELFPIRAPLMSLEHCIGPFLDGCDANNDHMITLKEWASCMQLEEEDIEEKCDDLRDN